MRKLTDTEEGLAPRISLAVDPARLAVIDAAAKRLGVNRSTAVRMLIDAGREHLPEAKSA